MPTVGVKGLSSVCLPYFRVEGPDAKKTACYDIDVEVVRIY